MDWGSSMGDYTKLIVNCSVKKTEDVEKLEQDIRERLDFMSSAYHCGGEMLEISNEWDHRTDITLVTQTKWGNGIEDFLEWLEPQVIDGFGDEEYFAIVSCEYGGFTIYSKNYGNKFYNIQGL